MLGFKGSLVEAVLSIEGDTGVAFEGGLGIESGLGGGAKLGLGGPMFWKVTMEQFGAGLVGKSLPNASLSAALRGTPRRVV